MRPCFRACGSFQGTPYASGLAVYGDAVPLPTLNKKNRALLRLGLLVSFIVGALVVSWATGMTEKVTTEG